MITPALSVGFVLLPHFTMTPFAALIDMLRLAADEGDRSRPQRVRWCIVGPGPVRSSAGVAIASAEPLGDARRFDVVIACGGLLHDDEAPDPHLLAWLRQANEVIGLCTASFTLAHAGLLDGRRACVSWFHHAQFRAAYPQVAVTGTELFVIDGPIVTCAGGTGAIDLGAWLVARHLGAATARKALDILLAEAARPPAAPQPHRAASSLADPRLRKAVLLAEQQLGDPPTVASLARAVGVSARQLERLFRAETGRSPRAFLIDERLRHARWLMTTTSRSLTAIAAETGFTDPAHFSRCYRQHFGASPSRDRAALRASATTGARDQPAVT